MKIKELRQKLCRLESSFNISKEKIHDLIREIDQEYPKTEDKEKVV